LECENLLAFALGAEGTEGTEKGVVIYLSSVPFVFFTGVFLLTLLVSL